MKRPSALAPRTIEDLRARLALPSSAYLGPLRRVMDVLGKRTLEGRPLLLECGHEVIINAGTLPHSSRCPECW